MKPILTTVALVCVLGGACATAPATFEVASISPNEVLLQTPRSAVGMTASGEGNAGQLQGPSVQLQWTPNTIRGTALGNPVSLDYTADEVKGLVGTNPVSLKIESRDEGVQAKGMYAGQNTRLEISPNRIAGPIGSCSYDLKLHGTGIYTGQRSCRGVGEAVSFSIGSEWTKLPAPVLIASVGPILATP
jgi:hypothetical protein